MQEGQLWRCIQPCEISLDEHGYCSYLLLLDGCPDSLALLLDRPKPQVTPSDGDDSGPWRDALHIHSNQGACINIVYPNVAAYSLSDRSSTVQVEQQHLAAHQSPLWQVRPAHEDYFECTHSGLV
jgi:hypothetical protein